MIMLASIVPILSAAGMIVLALIALWWVVMCVIPQLWSLINGILVILGLRKP